MTSVPDSCTSCGLYVADWYQHTRFHHWLIDEMNRRIRDAARELHAAQQDLARGDR